MATLKRFEDGAFGTADEKQCVTGTITKVELEDNRVKTLKLSPNRSIDPEGWSFFHPFIVRDKPDKYEILAMESDAAASVMKTLTDKKVRYSKLGENPKPPLFLWLVD